jgi:tetratricopeptide (TPR) repeat protein
MPRKADFSVSDEERQLTRRRRRRLLIAAATLLLLIGSGFFWVKPLGREIKGFQARRHAQKAFTFIEQEKWQEAQKSAVAAYQLRGTEPQAIRAVARLLSRTGEQQALEFWDQLEAIQPLTREDARDEATISLLLGESSRAEEAVQRVLAAEHGTPAPADWLLAARVAAQRADAEDAHDYLDKVLADTRSTEREQFQAALMRLSLPPADAATAESRRTAAREKLLQLTKSDTAVGLDALLATAQQAISRPAAAAEGSTLTPKEQSPDAPSSPAPAAGAANEFMPLPELAAAIERHPVAQPIHKFFALDLRLRHDPEIRATLIADAIRTWRDADAPGLAALAGWLNGKGEHATVLEVLSLERALQSGDVFLQYVDALAALARWEEIRQLLESERFPLDQVLQRMYLARTNAQLGQKAAAENNWQRAVEAAGTNLRSLMTLADYAEKNGAREVARAAYERAAAEAPRFRPTQQGRLRLAQAARDSAAMHAILQEMLALWPKDVAIQNDEAYLRLLRGASAGAAPASSEEPAAIEQLARSLVERNPASLPHRTLLALARLKAGRAAEALEVYQGLHVPQQALTQSALAVHAAVLVANGHIDDARLELAQVDAEQLLPEEQALITRIAGP